MASRAQKRPVQNPQQPCLGRLRSPKRSPRSEGRQRRLLDQILRRRHIPTREQTGRRDHRVQMERDGFLHRIRARTLWGVAYSHGHQGVISHRLEWDNAGAGSGVLPSDQPYGHVLHAGSAVVEQSPFETHIAGHVIELHASCEPTH